MVNTYTYLSRTNTKQGGNFFNSPSSKQSDNKPNINDLKQLFDDGKRHNNHNYDKQNILDTSSSSSRHYYDAKPSYIENDIPFDTKPNLTQRNMFDFERAKQKFDNYSSSRLKTPQSFKHSSSTKVSSSNKRSSSSGSGGGGGNVGIGLMYQDQPVHPCNDVSISKQNFNETVQFFDENLRLINKRDSAYTKGNSLNLDGLKVSEDDDVSRIM